jgi:hypothetical protein
MLKVSEIGLNQPGIQVYPVENHWFFPPEILCKDIEFSVSEFRNVIHLVKAVIWINSVAAVKIGKYPKLLIDPLYYSKQLLADSKAELFHNRRLLYVTLLNYEDLTFVNLRESEAELENDYPVVRIKRVKDPNYSTVRSALSIAS